jgi:hypothetical protein
VLDLELRLDNNTLRLHNLHTGERLPTSDEEVLARRQAEAARQEAERRLRAEAEARRAAETEAEHLRAELARLRAERGDNAS